MGYLIVARYDRDGGLRYCAWCDDDEPIMEEFRRWITTGDTLELLDYLPDHKHYLRATTVMQWDRHLRKEQASAKV